MKVYKVTLDNDYTPYYVTANHFNEAEKKILSQKVKEREEKKQNIFGEDGSLRAEVVGDAQEKPLVVRTIEMLTDNVI